MANAFVDMLEGMGKTVQPLATGEIIDYGNVPGAVVRYVRSEWKKPGAGQTKDWQMHIFRIPTGETFALGGCMELDSRLRSCKAGDTLALVYKGQDDLGDGRKQHRWTVTLVTISGKQLDAVIVQCQSVYEEIVAASAAKARERLAGRAPADGPPPHSDADAPSSPGGYRW